MCHSSINIFDNNLGCRYVPLGMYHSSINLGHSGTTARMLLTNLFTYFVQAIAMFLLHY